MAILSEDEDPSLVLIAQIQAGYQREENFLRLYLRHRLPVLRFFRRKGFSIEDSRDLTQDVFFRISRGINSFRRESRFERWLSEVATHVYFNEVRNRRTGKRDVLEQSLETQQEEYDPLTIQDNSPSPEEQVIKKEQMQIFRAALRELPRQMRMACLLRYEKGLKYEEIAIVMKISIETVKAHLHQGRKRLAATLETI